VPSANREATGPDGEVTDCEGAGTDDAAIRLNVNDALEESVGPRA